MANPRIEELQELLQGNEIISIERDMIKTTYTDLYTLKFTYNDKKQNALKSFSLINDELGNVNIYNRQTINGDIYWDQLGEMIDDIYTYCKFETKSLYFENMKSRKHDLELDTTDSSVIVICISTGKSWLIYKKDLHDSVLKSVTGGLHEVDKFLWAIYTGAR